MDDVDLGALELVLQAGLCVLGSSSTGASAIYAPTRSQFRLGSSSKIEDATDARINCKQLTLTSDLSRPAMFRREQKAVTMPPSVDWIK
jgi:hypothetical protein